MKNKQISNYFVELTDQETEIISGGYGAASPEAEENGYKNDEGLNELESSSNHYDPYKNFKFRVN